MFDKVPGATITIPLDVWEAMRARTNTHAKAQDKTIAELRAEVAGLKAAQLRPLDANVDALDLGPLDLGPAPRSPLRRKPRARCSSCGEALFDEPDSALAALHDCGFAPPPEHHSRRSAGVDAVPVQTGGRSRKFAIAQEQAAIRVGHTREEHAAIVVARLGPDGPMGSRGVN